MGVSSIAGGGQYDIVSCIRHGHMLRLFRLQAKGASHAYSFDSVVGPTGTTRWPDQGWSPAQCTIKTRSSIEHACINVCIVCPIVDYVYMYVGRTYRIAAGCILSRGHGQDAPTRPARVNTPLDGLRLSQSGYSGARQRFMCKCTCIYVCVCV